MKKLLISSIATLGLLGTSASAADMAVKASPPAPVAARGVGLDSMSV
jgi:hypothetical protein